MRNPPDRDRYQSSPRNSQEQDSKGRKGRTIRDMFADKVEQPLRRLTSAPARRRPPNAPPVRMAGNQPGRYDAYANDQQSQPMKQRWTEPGGYLAAEREPDRTSPRRPNGPIDEDAYGLPPMRGPQTPMRGPMTPSGRSPMRGPASGPLRGQASGPIGRSGSGSLDQNASADMRWQKPEWLNSAPMSANVAPPIDPAPPTTPRSGFERPGAPYYQPKEPDPDHGNTDYRATGIRAKLWASRTPSYEPDREPEPVAYSTEVESAYFQAYNARNTPAALAHQDASLAGSGASTYTPGATSEVERLRKEAEKQGKRTGGPAPYFWEMMSKPRPRSPLVGMAIWLVGMFLVFSTLLTGMYAGVSLYASSQLVYTSQVAPKGTPADAGLAFKEVEFLSRNDHLLLRGWFIPGVVSPGHLSTAQTIIMAHGIRTNRSDPGVGLLNLSDALANKGFAVLAFDLRGSGYSTSAPTSLGYFEQRDILGAVDFLESGAMPYPELGRPKAIGGWGVSMGAASMLMAASVEPHLRAIVSDSAYADVMPLLEREIPSRSGLPRFFTPGIVRASSVMYGIDFSADQPSAIVARIAPRPILFIHGSADTYVAPDNMTTLAQAAQQGSGAKVDSWLVPGAKHAQAFHAAGQAYIDRLVAFFSANLTPEK